jgi:hypothetical protein
MITHHHGLNLFEHLAASTPPSGASGGHFFAGRIFVHPFEIFQMKTFIAVILWFLLFALCWPLALIALILFPLIWLLLLPFRLVGFSLELIFRLIGTLLMLPFRLIKAI